MLDHAPIRGEDDINTHVCPSPVTEYFLFPLLGSYGHENGSYLPVLLSLMTYPREHFPCAIYQIITLLSSPVQLYQRCGTYIIPGGVFLILACGYVAPLIEDER